MTTTRTSQGYAINKAQAGQPEQWSHFYQLRSTVKICGRGEIVAVELREDSEGTHYAWWSNEKQRFQFLWWRRQAVEICFPYGAETETKRGRGELCRVSIVRKLAEQEETGNDPGVDVTQPSW